MLRVNYLAVDNTAVGPNLFSIYQLDYTSNTQLVNVILNIGKHIIRKWATHRQPILHIVGQQHTAHQLNNLVFHKCITHAHIKQLRIENKLQPGNVCK